MKSWGVLIVTAMGFLVGMVLAGVGGLSAKTSFFSEDLKQQKKLESYWADSGLGQSELYELISNENCQSSEKYFLACVNSVVQTAPSLQLEFNSQTGQLENISQFNTSIDRTEKEKISPFVTLYNEQNKPRIDFESIWKELIKQETRDKRATLIANGINGFLSIFKDPHTYILPNNYYEEVGSQLERSNTFVGVAFERIKDEIRVRKVFKNSDADKSGLKAQDIILSVDQFPTKQLNLQKLSQILKVADQKSFVFKVKRQDKIKEVVIKRTYKNLNHVQFEIIEGAKNTAVVTLTKFNRGVCTEVSKLIRSASDKNITGLIIDLRDNPGGQLDEAACLAGLFIGINKKIYSVEYFDPVKSNEVVLTSGSLLYTGPLSVLVNSSSASASELFAGALQEYKRAIIIGEKTFGKGTFQESEIWSKNSSITLFKTQGFYLLPSNFSPQISGISPDIAVNEQHQQLREENIYLNPIANQRDEKINSETTGYEEHLKKCTSFNKASSKEDALLEKALEVLACRSITATLATQFNVDDIN